MTNRDQRIERLLRIGTPKARIARELGISRDTVDRVAVRAGFPAQARSISPYDWDDVRRFYESGQSAAACRRQFGFSAATWEAAIARGDVVPRPRNSRQPPGKTRREVKRRLNEGRGVAEIAERLGISKPTVCYHARKLGVPAQRKFARRFDWEKIQRVYDSGVSMRECKERFGFSSQTWAEAVKRGDIVARDHRIPLNELLVRGRSTSRGHLKVRLVSAGLKENRCEDCGITAWRGRPLTMELHHINGDGTDNRLENLRFLCGNCHAQTETWGGRNRSKRSVRHLQLVEPSKGEVA